MYEAGKPSSVEGYFHTTIDDSIEDGTIRFEHKNGSGYLSDSTLGLAVKLTQDLIHSRNLHFAASHDTLFSILEVMKCDPLWTYEKQNGVDPLKVHTVKLFQELPD